MMEITLEKLQERVRDTTAFKTLIDYQNLCKDFLKLITRIQPTRIISPTHNNYVFFQYCESYGYRITRPLNTNLFIESADCFQIAFERFMSFISDLRKYQDSILQREEFCCYIKSSEINKIVYTLQQSIGCVGDSFENQNQSRKRIGQLFETLVKLIIRELGLECESRTINIPIPNYPDCKMSYELDLVFSRNKAIITAETQLIQESEIVGSIKTTSKDRIDKVFLDKYLLAKLLGREVPVIAIFLHDVQRAKVRDNIFGINSTFKSNHFLGYTVALKRLDGVYYVDLRPEMLSNKQLREEIKDFQTFLVRDLWKLSAI